MIAFLPIAPGSPEDKLQCAALPGSQTCPVISVLTWQLKLAHNERARLKSKGESTLNLSIEDLINRAFENVKQSI